MGRDESYREKMNSIGRELSALVNEIFSKFPTIIDENGRLSAWNELVDRSRDLMAHYASFYKENLNAPAPTRGTMLAELRVKVSDLGLKSAIDSLRGSGTTTDFQGPRLEMPRTLENIPAREEAAPAPAARAPTPARRPAPTIDELRRQGYNDFIDTEIGGTVYRFAGRKPAEQGPENPYVPFEQRSAEEMISAARSGELLMYEVNSRGYATRQIRRDSDFERLLGRL